MNTKEKIYLGIELGSTRIKSVLINENGEVRASGSHTWENRLENGLWTYSEADIHTGFSASVSDLVKNHGSIPDISAIGISGMMHGYIALDKNGELLAPFLTWRNTNAHRAADILSNLFGVKIPMRWSISQLYEAILNDEPHVKDIAHITTLAGYIHYKLTGEFVLGVCDASGITPVDSTIKDYDQTMLDKFDELIADKGYPWKIRDILPKVLCAGDDAGRLTEAGIKYIGTDFKPGIKAAPPEGDAGTGMVATNSIKVGTGNVSAGTSIFVLIVMDKMLPELRVDPETTPDGKPVAVIHCNNCTSDINSWAEMFCGAAKELGIELTLSQALEMMFKASERADGDISDYINYNFISGEPVAGVEKGVPMFMRRADSKLTFADFSRSLIYSCISGIALGMNNIYAKGVKVSEIFGHGGFFKTPNVGQRAMSAAIGAPVSVMETAGEGGAWGMALLAALTDKDISLEEYLDEIFASQKVTTLCATAEERAELLKYLEKYKKGLPSARIAGDAF